MTTLVKLTHRCGLRTVERWIKCTIMETISATNEMTVCLTESYGKHKVGDHLIVAETDIIKPKETCTNP